MMSGSQRRQCSHMTKLLPSGDEHLSQILRCIHILQYHAYEPGIIELFVLVDDYPVDAEDCGCPGDQANLERVYARIPALHCERGRDEDGSLAAAVHQMSILRRERKYKKVWRWKGASRVVGAFSNDQFLLRMAVCIMMDINEEWMIGREYLSLEE